MTAWCVSHHGRTRAAVFPIGIDPQKFAQLSAKAMTHPDVSRLRRSLNGEKLAIGVDRLDYSKGLINRIKAFDPMWTAQPQLSRAVSLLQIATPSRGAIEAYGNLQSEVAKLVTDVNGIHGEVDWTPIRYLNKGFGQAVLAGLYRTAQVGVVTPLQDGMNLVAKEYVAAQNPADPGVLVLSKFAGAANELDTALIVNPHDIDGMAKTIATAVSMPLTERRMRWEAMMEKLNGSTIQQWFADFVDALRETQFVKSEIGPVVTEPATVAGPLVAIRRAVSLSLLSFRDGCAGSDSGAQLRTGILEISGSMLRIAPEYTSLVAIRHAIEHGAARRLGARIFHRHHALALADEHALSDDDGRFVADDDAGVRRGQARARAVGPDDGIAREDAALAVVAAHIGALTGAGLRHGGAGGAGRDGESDRE